MGKWIKQFYSKEKAQMINKYVKICSTVLATKEIKTTLSFQLQSEWLHQEYKTNK